MSTKEELLKYLETHRETPVSGQALAEKLGVTRAAVWKAAKRLEAEGHRILAVTNRGYQLEADSDVLSAEGVRCHLPAAYQDCPVLVAPSVDSTNTWAKRLAADGAQHGTILLAEEQTAGRGRLGRAFFSPPGTGLYMSVLLRPQMDAGQLAILTIAAAVAAAQSIEALAACQTQIKWVNDILLEGKKVAGILTEAVSDFESGMADSVIVGIGVNVRAPLAGFPQELQAIAGALPAGRPVSRNTLAADAAGRLLAHVDALPEKAFLRPYRQRSMVLGRRVAFLREGVWCEGCAEEIDEQGRLLVRTGAETVPLRAGEVRLLEDASA